MVHSDSGSCCAVVVRDSQTHGFGTCNTNNYRPAAEDEASDDDAEDEAASSKDGDNEVVGETQPGQQQQLPILTSPTNDGRRYQLRSTPEHLLQAQRGQQQQRYPFIDATRVRGLGGGRTTVNAVASTSFRDNNNTLHGAARQATISVDTHGSPPTTASLIACLLAHTHSYLSSHNLRYRYQTCKGSGNTRYATYRDCIHGSN